MLEVSQKDDVMTDASHGHRENINRILSFRCEDIAWAYIGLLLNLTTPLQGHHMGTYILHSIQVEAKV